MKRFLILLTVLLASAFARGEDADALAARILNATARPVGLAHLPHCGDGTLALALAHTSPGTFIHGQDADAAHVAAARQAADAVGVLGRHVWIDQGGLDRLLPAGRSCDLVAVTDLAGGDLTPQLAGEIGRVLHPWYGVAVLGNASKKLDPAALLAWAKTIAKDAAPLPGDGTLVIVHAASLPGADDWAQWWHGADNNAVSTDTAFRLPGTIQWTDKPYFGPTRLELPIVSGGRLFMLWNGHEMDASAGMLLVAGPDGDGPLLTAQAAGSGARLWGRRLSKAAWVQVSRSIVVGDNGRLLVADGSTILELDAATGKEVRRKALDCPEIKWMTLSAGRLFVLGGSVTENFGQRSEKAVAPFRLSGCNLIALDRKTLEPIWRVDRQEGQNAFDPRSPAIDGERLFIAGEADAAEAFSVKDGKPLWRVQLGFTRSRLVTYDWDRSSRHPVTGYAIAGVYVISGLEMKDAVILSQNDGKQLWTKPQPGAGQFIPLAFWDLLWQGDHSLDPLTGKAKGKMKVGDCFVGRDGDGRDFPVDEKTAVTGIADADKPLYRQLRLVSAPTTYTVAGLAAGQDYVVRLHLFEPWNDKAGRRLMDVAVNGAPALQGFDTFATAGGKNKAIVQDLRARADAGGRLAIGVCGTAGCPDPNPVICGFDVRQGADSVVRFPAAGPLVPVKGFRLLRESCSRDTMAPFLADTAYAPPEPLKSSCGAGTFVADGQLWKFPVPCEGCTEWRGFIVQSAGETALKPTERLHSAAAVPPPATKNSEGWLTYRGDASRACSTAATVPTSATVRWAVAPVHPGGELSEPGKTMVDPEMVPAPPLVTGDRIVVAQADGSVDALDLSSGKRLWRAYTSGRIQSSPAIWRDRVFVGSGDGNLYAFALADGRELWRLRAGPDVGRVMVYGQFSSRWPILGSPIVTDGKVVVSAGLVGMVDGVHVVCADAASGQVLWDQGDWTTSESGGKISGGAQFAGLGGDLFYHGGMAPPIRIAMKDGADRPAFPETAGSRMGSPDVRKWKTCQAFAAIWGSVKGQDVGAISDNWIAYGGRRIWTDQSESGTWRSTVKFLSRDRDGNGQLPVVDVQDCELMPVWDDRDAVFVCHRGAEKPLANGGIVMIARDKFKATLDSLMAGTSTTQILAMDDQPPENAVTIPAELLTKPLKASAEGLSRWSSPLQYGWQPLACVLAKNAVLLLTVGLPNRAANLPAPCRLTALDRADGRDLWEVALPARAVYDGLAVAADGSAVVTLMDGQTVCIGMKE